MEGAKVRHLEPLIEGHRHGRVPRAVRERQLLDAALRLFAERGFAGTSISDIAAAAAVTRPVIYDHFGSKEGVYLACLRRARAELDRELLSAGAVEAEPLERIASTIDAYFAFVERHGDEWEVLFGDGAAITGEVARVSTALRFDTVERLTRLFDATMPTTDTADVAVYAHLVTGAAERLAKWWRANPEVPRARVVEYVLQLVTRGLGPLIPEP